MSDPVILLAHGSPDPRSARVVRQIAVASGARAAFLDFDRPDPVSALLAVADAGHRRATVIPLLLTNAYHGRVDVPRVIAAARRRRPELTVTITAPVGDVGLLPALAAKLPPCDGVVLSAAGTRDAGGLGHVADIAAALAGRIGVPCVAGFASAGPRDTGQAARVLRADGARRIAVASYFIAPGQLFDRAAATARAAGAGHVTDPLGACRSLLEVIAERRTASVARRRGATALPAQAVPGGVGPADRRSRRASGRVS